VAKDKAGGWKGERGNPERVETGSGASGVSRRSSGIFRRLPEEREGRWAALEPRLAGPGGNPMAPTGHRGVQGARIPLPVETVPLTWRSGRNRGSGCPLARSCPGTPGPSSGFAQIRFEPGSRSGLQDRGFVPHHGSATPWGVPLRSTDQAPVRPSLRRRVGTSI
jgi:hypothetical protein